MSRWERVNCASLVAILAILLLLAGSYLPAAHGSTQQPIASDQVSTQVDGPEDEPAESDQEPSGIDGMTIAELHQDAADMLQSLPVSAPHGQFEIIPEYAASYASAAPAFPADYFNIQSVQHPGVFHVFHMVAAQRA